MSQINKLYDIISAEHESVLLKMLDEHPVYQGHFPGNPITPGVLTLRMVRECVGRETGRQLHYSAVKNCRFVALIRPGDTLRLQHQITDNGDSITVKAILSEASNPDDLRLQLEAEMR